MNKTEKLNIQYDGSKATVSFGGKIVELPGSYRNNAEAEAAAIAYARKHLGYRG